MKRTIVEFDAIDSTNSHLKRYHQGYPDHTFVRAKYQEKGRGRFDRKWVSARDRNLLFSLLLKHVAVRSIDQIQKRVVRVLLSFFHGYGITARFKEPNDIHVKGKKIAGILIETQGSGDSYEIVIIGIGINVNQVEFAPIPATSMALETGRTYDPDALFESLSMELHERTA